LLGCDAWLDFNLVAFRLRLRRTAVIASVRSHAAAGPEDLAELRLLVELSALRRLAGRGLSDQELAVVRKLADATARAARGGDVLGYRRGDMVFHLCLLELSGDPALSDIARLLLMPDRTSTPSAEDSGSLLLEREAREHRDLIGMLADGMVSAADDLLRLHLSRQLARRPAPAHLATSSPACASGE
jgi:DNA-binding GntR family transcriptional regulator